MTRIHTHLACVPPWRVAEAWPRIAATVKRATEKAGNGGFETIAADLLAGRSVLWLALDDGCIDAYAITGLFQDRGRKVCVVTSCGGVERGRWLHHLARIEAWAAGEGCRALRVYGRRGWRRVLTGYTAFGDEGGIEKALT